MVEEDGASRKPIEALSVHQWKVLKTIGARLKVEGDTKANRGDYELQVKLPTGTGLQFANSPDAECDWDWPKNWPSFADAGRQIPIKRGLTQNSMLNLIRCGIGDGISTEKNADNSASTITIELFSAGSLTSTPDPLEIEVERSWHQADSNITYRICPDSGTKLSDVSLDNATVDKIVTAGTRFWTIGNKEDLGIEFGKITSPKCDEKQEDLLPVTIAIVDDDLVSMKCGLYALGCAFATSGTKSVYPHLGPQSIIIRYITTKPETMWVSRPQDMIHADMHYMPGTVAHEMGHAAGLGHSTKTSGGLMHTGGLMHKGYLRANLAENDIKAIKSIYEDAHAHDK